MSFLFWKDVSNQGAGEDSNFQIEQLVAESEDGSEVEEFNINEEDCPT